MTDGLYEEIAFEIYEKSFVDLSDLEKQKVENVAAKLKKVA